MNHRTLLSRATEGTDAPTPGYLYVDLAKVCTGNPGVCQECAAVLIKRLTKTNPNIKAKAAKVIAKLCDSVPRNAFRRCISQDHNGITEIKNAMNYRGTPDPVRGDEPNQRVRNAARECLDAVYREAPTSEQAYATSNPNASYQGISSNYSPSPHAAAASSSSSSSSRMQGIGNPMYSDPRNDPRYNGEMPQTKFGSVVKEASEVIAGMIKDPLARNVTAMEQPRHSTGSYGGPTYGRPPPGSADLSRRTGGQWTMASNRGPGAIQHHNAGNGYHRDSTPASNYPPSSASSGTVGGSWGSASVPSHSTPTITVNSAPVAPAAGPAVSDGTYEKNLVKELCPPGGMKPVPPPDKLANFARACPSLNSDLVCPVLLDCLEEGQPWVIRAKALCAMETAIANGVRPDQTNPYRDFFHACADEIRPLAAHPRTAIHEPAARILTLLGLETTNGVGSAVSAAPVAAAPNLLDFDAPAPAAAAPAAPAASAPASMFGGMNVKGTAPAAAPPVAAPPVAAPPVAAAPSLLDFTAPAAPAAADVFAPEPAEANVAPTTMFDQLNLKDNAPEPADVPVNGTDEAAGAASGFGFINTAEPPPAPESFDPLKGGSPSSAQKKSMQMSPEQIQAMAYQQQQQWMMQQQYQYQTMAMQKQMMAMQQQMNFGRQGVPMMRMPSQGSGMGVPPQFSFQPKPVKEDDKKFDFVKDAMHKKK